MDRIDQLWKDFDERRAGSAWTEKQLVDELVDTSIAEWNIRSELDDGALNGEEE